MHQVVVAAFVLLLVGLGSQPVGATPFPLPTCVDTSSWGSVEGVACGATSDPFAAAVALGATPTTERNAELKHVSMPDVLLLVGVVIFFSSVLRFVRAERRKNR